MLHAHMVLEEQLSLQQAAMEAQAGRRAGAGAGAEELIQSSLAQEGAKGWGFSLTHPPSSIELERARKFPPSSALLAAIAVDLILQRRRRPYWHGAANERKSGPRRWPGCNRTPLNFLMIERTLQKQLCPRFRLAGCGF